MKPVLRFHNHFLTLIYCLIVLIKGWVKIYGVPGPGPSTGGENFFSKKIRGKKTFFQRKKGGRILFFRKNKGGEDFFSKKIRGATTFFTIIFENPRFHFSKKAIFEDQKVI